MPSTSYATRWTGSINDPPRARRDAASFPARGDMTIEDAIKFECLKAMRDAEEFLGMILPSDDREPYPWEEHGLRVRRALQKALRLVERAEQAK
jgi:hypothetical protein